MDDRFRKYTEELEERNLSKLAARSAHTKGREHSLEPCAIRTQFQRDRDRIIHCKSFRRLKHKTQMFLTPDGDHFRTRMTHTLEVGQVARTIARALRLNEDLTEAIAMGHDLGHTPFGHSGERALASVSAHGFRHNEQSLRVVEVLENDAKGLNLTYEVRDGIRCHTGKQLPCTLEGQVVRLADRIAYINHDIDDALRGGLLKFDELPADCIEILGHTHGERIETMIVNCVQASFDKDIISMSEPVAGAMDRLRDFMFERVYNRSIDGDLERRIWHVVCHLYEYFLDNISELPKEFQPLRSRWGDEQVVTDYVAGMTDRYALLSFSRKFVPTPYN
ncbi:MAG: deoxyguanosinetriphosphate triphosphohydrolase [Christensenellales bacterium]